MYLNSITEDVWCDAEAYSAAVFSRSLYSWLEGNAKITKVKVETSKERSETNLPCALTYDPNVP